MAHKKDKKQKLEMETLKQHIALLETENRHLLNELKLTSDEKETAKKNYYDIISNIENKVAQRTKEISELQKKYREKSSELQLMLDASPAMIFYKDVQRRYIRVNREFAKTVGVPAKAIIGKTYTELFPDRHNQSLEDDNEVLEKGKAVLDVTNTVHTTKGLRVTLIDKIPYKDMDGNIIGIIGFALDITALKEAEKEKEILKERLSHLEKMEAIGRLAGGVAHDLNNVLSAVVGYPDLMMKNLPPDSPFNKYITTMKKSGQKAAAIVEDLLTLARRGVPVTEVLNLNEIVSTYLKSPEFETLKSFNPQVTLESRLEKDLLNIKGSPIHLTQTVMNLVANAAEATLRQGTVTLTTTNIYLDEPATGYDLAILPGEYVVLTVSDNGVGIPPRDLKKIFEPFYTKKVMGRSGTGLGMAVVWGTVKDHKGNIIVTSEEGKGSTFRLYFPVTREPLVESKDQVPVKKYTGRRETILVVDDVEEQREISVTLLSSLNYNVVTATSGAEAITLLKNTTVDLVILDMIMDPGIDGLDTYKEILKIRPGQKAVITSGYSETERVREAQNLGAGQYIKKPYTLEKIGLAVRKELDKNRKTK